MRKIIYTRPDGGLSVVHPVINTHTVSISTGKVVPVPETLTEAEAEQRAWDRLPKDAINPQWVEAGAVPTDRTFRNAWEHDGNGGIRHNMQKARDLHREKLRGLRKPKMDALDAAYMRADELGDSAEKQRIAALKQALRDVTADPAIEAARSTEELKAVMPDALR